MKTTTKTPERPPLFVKLPPALAELVTTAAQQNRRSRSAEVALRLEKTFGKAARAGAAK